ncbi:SIP domain-containing protein [Mucilaginibacter sp. KACC 22773]|uniref:siderophore-interacting protein n=1 Tax=Mucilaginibacter sp. KACC 22773 TaxID=3025671 RepID=UPI002366EA66|nr:SIP domain-containing protein [Mucilaginibacter sp. KACC 22773]WDF77081.1 SIP domain-containing protein [Mucilaginibacter sp. KACC 22773]
MGIIEKLLMSILIKAEITYKEQITPHTFHIRLQSDSVIHTDYKAGNFLRIFVGKGRDVSIRDNIRSYSVWQIDQPTGCIDIAACTHSAGPGSHWVKNCEVGNQVHFSWHKSNLWVDTAADNYVFIGDLSALGHFYELYRNLPEGKIIYSLIYGEHAADFFADIDGSRPFNFYPFSQNPNEDIIPYLHQISQLPIETTKALIAGEGRLCVDLNNFFRKGFNWKSDQLRIKPFWVLGKKGLE